jgi:hypothetical protein
MTDDPASVGFLSPGLAGDVERIRRDFAPWFALADEFNRLGMRVLPSLQPASDSNDGLVAALLFARTLTSFQGIVLLAERGMSGDARTLLRAASESVIVLNAVGADATVCYRLIDSHFRDHKKMRNAWLEDADARKIMTPAQVDAIRASIQDAERDHPLPKGPSNPMALEPLAKLGRTGALYNAVYRSTSGDAAHVTADSLNRHAQADRTGQVVGLKLGPAVTDLADTLFGAMWSLATALEAVQAFFCRPFGEGHTAVERGGWGPRDEARAELVNRLLALGDPSEYRPGGRDA